MFCLYSESHLCTFFSIFFTCIYIPFFHVTKSVLSLFRYILNPHQLPENHSQETEWELNLAVLRFQDLSPTSDEKEMCSICLMEFENEDSVNKLPRCGHVFHVECMQKWMDQCHFTCPLCRSLVFPAPSSSCKNRNSTRCP